MSFSVLLSQPFLTICPFFFHIVLLIAFFPEVLGFLIPKCLAGIAILVFLERILGVVVATQLEVQTKEDEWTFNDHPSSMLSWLEEFDEWSSPMRTMTHIRCLFAIISCFINKYGCGIYNFFFSRNLSNPELLSCIWNTDSINSLAIQVSNSNQLVKVKVPFAHMC